MYVTILHALDLESGQSFLNIGSGSGYLSCLASCLLGDCGLSHGIEIDESLVSHCRDSCTRWFDTILERRNEGEGDLPCVSSEGVSFVHGNCFDIDVPRAESSCKYDRIYIGAGCPEKHLEFFFSLLADDGVLVVPVHERNELLKIRRILGSVYSTTHISNVHYAPLVKIPAIRSNNIMHMASGGLTIYDQDSDEEEEEEESEDDSVAIQDEEGDGGILVDAGDISVTSDDEDNGFDEEIDGGSEVGDNNVDGGINMDSDSDEEEEVYIGGGSNVSAVEPNNNGSSVAINEQKEKLLVKLPPVLWAPTISRHKQFPPSFRSAVKVILCASRYVKTPAGMSSYCDRVPFHVWAVILGYCTRDWFLPVQSGVDLLSAEVAVERKMRLSAEKSLREINETLRKAERERDVLRLMVLRLQRSLSSSNNNASSNNANGTSIASQIITSLFNSHQSDTEENDGEEDEEDAVADAEESYEEEEETTIMIQEDVGDAVNGNATQQEDIVVATVGLVSSNANEQEDDVPLEEDIADDVTLADEYSDFSDIDADLENEDGLKDDEGENEEGKEVQDLGAIKTNGYDNDSSNHHRGRILNSKLHTRGEISPSNMPDMKKIRHDSMDMATDHERDSFLVDDENDYSDSDASFCSAASNPEAAARSFLKKKLKKSSNNIDYGENFSSSTDFSNSAPMTEH